MDAIKYDELWDNSQFDLLSEACQGAMKDVGITKDDIDAAWLGNYYFFISLSGTTLGDSLRLDGKPITRCENYCASGMDTFRNDCLGVVSEVYDVALVCGVEKLMDQGEKGLPGGTIYGHPVLPRSSAPTIFCLLVTRNFHEYG